MPSTRYVEHLGGLSILNALLDPSPEGSYKVIELRALLDFPPPTTITTFWFAMDKGNNKDFFKRLINRKPNDASFVSDVQWIERAFKGKRTSASGTLKVGAVAGVLVFSVDNIEGNGPCSAKGAGLFTGPLIPSNVTSGTYKMKFGTLKVTLELYDSAGGNIFTYVGYGYQRGLSNKDGKPWEGTFHQ